MKNHFLILTAFFLFINCNMKPQEKQIDIKEYEQLSENPVSKLYETKKIIDKKHGIKYFLFDLINKNLIVKGFNDPVDSDYIAYALKLNVLGEQIDNLNTNRILNEGTDWYSEEFSNWVISGDTNKLKYNDPLSDTQKHSPEKWLKKFKELYGNSQYVYIYMTDYYFKIEDKWYLVEAFKKAKELGLDIKKQYPAKEDQDVRMVDLKDQMPNLMMPPEKRDTSLIKQIKYTSTFFEKSDRGDAFNYSAGWWYFEIYMPGGDTLKIKRFASFRDPEMKLYKIPKELSGREDVLFIIQEPNEIHPEQTGGMYVIRPKNYKETPQYKEQEAKELAKEKEQKQKESQEAVKKRRNFLPD